MADGIHTPRAEQIINLKGDKIILNAISLEQILSGSTLREKQVCVISITGAFRQGKSFLLNYFVRYLHVRYNNLKRLNGSNWLNSADGPISGFPWKIGSQRHTEGILMWSEIFLAELPSGEEVAIILLDTQGSFDNHSSISSCAAIFALSTLISSVQIYNLKETIKQYDLAHLECFSGYGQLAGDFNKSPFQDLIFLIRDWPWPHEKEYGANGGQELLNEIFHNSLEQPSELVSQVKNIKELFQNISCVLLPHPGFKVASAVNFQGDLEEIDPAFNKQVEAFVSSILAPEKLVPKTVNGEKIKVGDLFHFIQSYCNHFLSGKMPSLDSMFTATSDAHHAVAVKKAKAIYEESMESVKSGTTPALEKFELYLKNQQGRDKALQYFSNKKIMGNTDIKKKFQSILEKKLCDKFMEYENINEIKYQKEQDIKRETQLRKEQQLENERRLKEEQRLHEERLKHEQELRRLEQIRMEKERQREEELRKEHQRNFEKYRQELELGREQERRQEEERIKEQQRQHEREMAKIRREERERREYELELRRDSQMFQPTFYPCLSSGFENSFSNSMNGLSGILGSMSVQQPEEPRRRGRPPGSKNKPKVDLNIPEPVDPPRRGRPPGSKNKPKLDLSFEAPVEPPRRGRPPGSTNKPKPMPIAPVAADAAPRRGRPPGSKNKPK